MPLLFHPQPSTPPMPSFATILNVVVAVYTTYIIGDLLWSHRQKLGFILDMWKRFRPTRLLGVLAMLLVTGMVGDFVYHLHPVFQWGWANLFMEGGGNIIFSPVSGVESAEGAGISLQWLYAVGFTLSLALALPFLAFVEEKLFRGNINSWKGVIIQACIFGPVHLLAGIPIAYGIAIIVPGLFFGWLALRRRRQVEAGEVSVELVELVQDKQGEEVSHARAAAVQHSTVYHSLYNTVIVVILLTRLVT